MITIAGEEQRPIEIDPVREACQKASGRDPERSANHATDQ
jgi:hypothetical protein